MNDNYPTLANFLASIRNLTAPQLHDMTEEQCAILAPPRNWYSVMEGDFSVTEHGYYTPAGMSPEAGDVFGSEEEVNGKPMYAYSAKEAVIAWVSDMPPQYPDPEWIQAVLDYDPFDGDFGDGTEHSIANEIRVAKRGGKCWQCGGPIQKGEVVRVFKIADSEGIYGGRCCRACCDAMAVRDLDEGESIEERLRDLVRSGQ